jgi:hypothetical protein
VKYSTVYLTVQTQVIPRLIFFYSVVLNIYENWCSFCWLGTGLSQQTVYKDHPIDKKKTFPIPPRAYFHPRPPPPSPMLPSPMSGRPISSWLVWLPHLANLGANTWGRRGYLEAYTLHMGRGYRILGPTPTHGGGEHIGTNTRGESRGQHMVGLFRGQLRGAYLGANK